MLELLMKNCYYLMRHGESLANLADIIVSAPENGCHSYGLSERGRDQARASAAALGIGVDQVFASDFLRTRQTAELAAEVLGVSCVTWDSRLRERHFGWLEGKSAQNYREVWLHDETSPECPLHQVESVEQVTSRLLSLVNELESHFQGQTFLLVSHGDPLRFLQLWAVGREPHQHQSIRHFDPAEIRLISDVGGDSARRE